MDEHGTRRWWRPIVTGLGLPLRLLPTPMLEHLLTNLATRRARRLPPDAALRLLLRLDAAIYTETGRQSVRYGGGEHTKHRHTAYHRFFVDRIRPDQRVLDVGCGIGAVALDIAEQAGGRVTGIDLNAASIDKAREQRSHPNVTFIHGDALHETPDEPFDVIVLSNVLEHIDQRPKLLRALVRRHRPGRVLIRVPCFDRDWRVPLKRELGIDERLDADHKTEYTAESFRDEMDRAGLRIDELNVRWGEIWAVLSPREEEVGHA